MVITFFWALCASIFYSSLTILLYPLDPRGTRWRWRLAQRWGRALTKAFGLQLKIHGRNDVRGEPAVLICNHLSAYDIYVVGGAMNRPIRWIAKDSIKYIPLIGWGMYSLHCCFLKRNQSRQDRDRLNATAVSLRPDHANVMIFPQGTRVRSGEMGEFKKGAFHMAKVAGVQIIPLCLKGTNHVKHNSRFWWRVRHPVELAIGPPISAADVQNSSVEELMQRGRAAILELQKQLG